MRIKKETAQRIRHLRKTCHMPFWKIADTLELSETAVKAVIRNDRKIVYC